MSGATAARELVISRRLRASRQLVWQAWTDPSVMVRWLHPHGLTTKPGSVEVDLSVGGRFRFTMVAPSGEEHPSEGEYLELDPPHLLRSTWGAPGAPVAELEVRLSALSASETEMIFVLRGVDDDSARDDSVWTGWREAIAELEEEIRRSADG